MFGALAGMSAMAVLVLVVIGALVFGGMILGMPHH